MAHALPKNTSMFLILFKQGCGAFWGRKSSAIVALSTLIYLYLLETWFLISMPSYLELNVRGVTTSPTPKLLARTQKHVLEIYSFWLNCILSIAVFCNSELHKILINNRHEPRGKYNQRNTKWSDQHASEESSEFWVGESSGGGALSPRWKGGLRRWIPLIKTFSL